MNESYELYSHDLFYIYNYQLSLDSEATSFVFFHASTTAKISLLRNRDGDSDYQMKIAELFLVAQYYGALYLVSIQLI